MLGRQAVRDGLRLHAVLQAGLAAAALSLLHLLGVAEGGKHADVVSELNSAVVWAASLPVQAGAQHDRLCRGSEQAAGGRQRVGAPGSCRESRGP